jgi:THO complex subunit 7
MASTTNEDEIIKKRLLIEGDSGNEDRCINKLIKLFIRWSQNVNRDKLLQQSDDELNDIANAQETMLAVISHIEFGLMRNQFIYDMNMVEQENYEKLYKKIDFDIEKAKNDIVQSKIDLQEALKIRKNRQEYDVLAREINNYPDRQEMQATIERLDKNLEQLKVTKTDLNHKIDLRRKQFSVLFKSVSSMKVLLENDQYNDISEDIDLNDVTDTSISKMELSEIENDNFKSHSRDYTNEASPLANAANNNNDEKDEYINKRMELDE